MEPNSSTSSGGGVVVVGGGDMGVLSFLPNKRQSSRQRVGVLAIEPDSPMPTMMTKGSAASASSKPTTSLHPLVTSTSVPAAPAVRQVVHAASKPPVAGGDNNATHEPAKSSRVSSSALTVTSSSSSSSSSSASRRAGAVTNKTIVRPEIEAKRKDIKTPPLAANNQQSNNAKALASTAERTGSAASSSSSSSSSHRLRAHPLPSALVNKHKQAPVWSSGKNKHTTSFGAAYDAGEIPCRINHGSIKNSLQWTKEPETLAFDPLLVKCVDGFQETQHPFVFLARESFRQLMRLEDARDKVLPILPKVINSLRAALMAKEDDTFLMALEATRLLSDAVEDELNAYLPKLLQQIHRKLQAKSLRDQVEATLSSLEQNGGKEALSIIHTKIPTYVSMG